MFACDNGYCLPKQFLCDHEKDCVTNGEDEKDCMNY